MKRAYIIGALAAVAIAGTAWAVQNFNPGGSFTQVYAVLMNLTTGVPYDSTNPLPVSGTFSPAPASNTPVALNATSVTSGTPVNVVLTTGHAKGGWIKNCNAAGVLYINDNGTAGTNEATSNAALAPGTGGAGGTYYIAPGTTAISANASTGTLTICGEGYN